VTEGAVATVVATDETAAEAAAVMGAGGTGQGQRQGQGEEALEGPHVIAPFRLRGSPARPGSPGCRPPAEGRLPASAASSDQSGASQWRHGPQHLGAGTSCHRATAGRRLYP